MSIVDGQDAPVPLAEECVCLSLKYFKSAKTQCVSAIVC